MNLLQNDAHIKVILKLFHFVIRGRFYFAILGLAPRIHTIFNVDIRVKHEYD